jgi:hypothetical protein
MKLSKAIVYMIFALIVALAGCSEAPETPAEPAEAEAPPEPIDGQTAFYRMFPAARTWAPDAMGLHLESLNIEEVPAGSGKFGAWRATYYSPSKNRVAVFNYSVVEVGGKIQKGVFQDHEESYSAGRTKPWPAIALKVASDKALATAKEQEKTKAYIKENPDKPVFILVEQTPRHPSLAYRIVWGNSVSRSDFSVFIDASTGNFLEVLR